jgi:hypothetical protein
VLSSFWHCGHRMSFAGSRFSPGSAPRPSQYGVRRMEWNNLQRVLIAMCDGTRAATNSLHSSSREGHLSTRKWNFKFSFLLMGAQAATGVLSRVQRNSVPSLQMRCMITANRRASATMAF